MLTAIRLLCAAALLCGAIGSSFIVTGSARAWSQAAPARTSTAATARGDEIVLDGRVDDWVAVAPATVDRLDAPRSFIDFHTVKVADDPAWVHLLVDFGNTVSVQRLPGRAVLLFDADGNARTGSELHGLDGVDITVELTPANTRDPSRTGMGIGVQSATYQPPPDDPNQPALSPYDIGFTFAPTHASRVVEFRIERGVTLPQTPTVFTGSRFRGKLVFLNIDGRVGDETDVFTHRFATRAGDASPAASMTSDPLTSARGTLRVVSWNAEHGSMFPNPDPFARILRALKPDVILWQELTNRNSASQLAAFLDNHLPAVTGQSGWQVVFGRGGGDLRTAIASRHPLMPIEAMDVVPYPDRLDRELRISGAIAEIHDRRVLFSSVHLKCCGELDSREDNRRRTESRLINKAIRTALTQESIDGIVVGGDINLVGAPEPLYLIGRGLDGEDGNLKPLDAMRLNGRSNATWSDRDQPFVPGRLDYLLYSGSFLSPQAAFSLETGDLPARWLEWHGLLASDSLAASDHWPLVADFAFSPTARD